MNVKNRVQTNNIKTRRGRWADRGAGKTIVKQKEKRQETFTEKLRNEKGYKEYLEAWTRRIHM